LAKIFRKRRFEKGAMRFERAEVSFVLDDQGNPIDVLPKVMVDSNRLIEEFMLLANKAVAEKIGGGNKSGETTSKSKSFVYRIHDYPDPEKLKSFAMVVKQFGYSIDIGSKEKISFAINQLLSEVKGKPESNLLETLAIRSMSKAVYSPENIGHYGLGFTFYSHFTSPIRRYPDLIIHRLLDAYETGKEAGKKGLQPLDDMCRHCSIQEKKAEEAERSSRKFKQAQFLKNKEGESFDGIISGIMDFGFFVELTENKCEGLVRMQSLHDDHYVFDKDNYSIKGRQWGKKYQLGDMVSVMVSEVDIIKKQVDLEIVH
jgi:ribonuclease R